MATYPANAVDDDLERLMAEPWSPESYLSDNDEDSDANNETDGNQKLSQLFEANLNAIENDMIIVQSNKKHSLETVGSLDDEDALSKFMTYQDPSDHLRTLDTVNLANAKEISTDIDRFNHFKQRNSIDNDEESMSITIDEKCNKEQCEDEIDKLIEKMPAVITNTPADDVTHYAISTDVDDLIENFDPYESDELYLAEDSPSQQQQHQSHLFDIGLMLPDIPESLPTVNQDVIADDCIDIKEDKILCSGDVVKVSDQEVTQDEQINDLLTSVTELDISSHGDEIPSVEVSGVAQSSAPNEISPEELELNDLEVSIDATAEDVVVDDQLDRPLTDEVINNHELSPSSDSESNELQSPAEENHIESETVHSTTDHTEDVFIEDDRNRLRAISATSTQSSAAASEGSLTSVNAEAVAPMSVAPPPFSETDIPIGASGLGMTAPVWIPDTQATECRMCQGRFTVMRRRHHCRACGQVFCKNCCNMRAPLTHLQYKIARVCQPCYEILLTTDQTSSSRVRTNTDPPTRGSPPPGYHEASSGDLPPRYPAPPPPLDRFGQPVYPPSQNRGITPPQPSTLPSDQMPGSDVNIGNPRPQRAPSPEYTALGRPRQSRMRTESEMSAVIMFNSSRTNLPPILKNVDGVLKIINNPNVPSLILQMQDSIESPVVFLVNKNLIVKVKITDLDCCIKKKCWSFSTDGMGASNQEEIALVLEYSENDDDTILLKKVLQQINAIFERAKQGEPVNELSYMTFEALLCLDPSMTSFLFFKRTNQCIENLLLPQSPHLFGLMIHKQEIPWARNFPLRLLLRHRAESPVSPSHLVSPVRREPYYAEIGRTIIELLADFRGFQYTLPRIPGVTIMMKSKDLTVKLPQGRHDEIVKAFSMEDNIVSLAGGYSTRFDAFLACNQVDGGYKTQILTVNGHTKKVTGACFVIFSAALKVEDGQPEAKANVVEDGIMVQVTSELMQKIRIAVNDSKDLKVPCSKRYSEEVGKLKIQWTSADSADASRPCSPIDGTPFSSLTNMKIRHSYDYTTNSLLAKIHWMEVYFLPNDSDTLRRLSARELGQLTSSVAKACMSALSPHLSTLIALEMNKIGLRVNLDSEVVEYKIGANQQSLPGELSGDLDDKLIPAIHSVITTLPQGRVVVELVFNVVQIV